MVKKCYGITEHSSVSRLFQWSGCDVVWESDSQHALARLFQTSPAARTVSRPRAITPVSYTHLDVYKRQGVTNSSLSAWDRNKTLLLSELRLFGRRGVGEEALE